MMVQRYVHDILQPHVLPLMQRHPGAIFQQENARSLTARVSQDCLHTVTILLWSARSPDLSPIEHIWDHLGCARVEDFYDGKSILLTGASGYLGVVLLESLLRGFPKIRSIYILLREKKGVKPESRKELIFKKEIFNKLKEKQPDVFDKVHVIPGDVALPRMGMSETNFLKLIEEVTVVFHVAASISFVKPLRFMLVSNAMALDYVLDFCRQLKKLDILVYTSTAYSNSNREKVIEEQIYRLPFPAQRFLDEIKSENDEGLNYLVSHCSPKWPNNYTFSKCLSENIILDKAADLPIAIVRPSIIVSCWKGISPGYVEEGSGMVDLGLAVSKLRILFRYFLPSIDCISI
ncbi:fatty acyl-CoA reductase 1 [Trichonephila clavipes]|nr:fatty acyl-CoA reductase 1 [Trichonephila clavipes]